MVNIKAELLNAIIARLSADLRLYLEAARNAHMAATDEENQPDNKYDTLALESSYLAQGQANRAQELRSMIDAYRRLDCDVSRDDIRLGSYVVLKTGTATVRKFFVGPYAGGLVIDSDAGEVMVITPASPLGKLLMGRTVDDIAVLCTGRAEIEYRICSVC